MTFSKSPSVDRAAPPLVSIIMPTHDRPAELRIAIQSVLEQSHENWELIVVNDGGGDVSSVISLFNDSSRIHYIQLARSRGAAAARNVGLSLARGEYVTYLDDDDWLYLTDRKAHMIISGGVNIYPQEAENRLITHPKVQDVAVIGVPNEDFGEEVKAVVQPMDMGDASPALAQELMDYCRQKLAGIKCPRSIDFQSELPRHPTGKLYKRLLKERYWEGHSSQIV